MLLLRNVDKYPLCFLYVQIRVREKDLKKSPRGLPPDNAAFISKPCTSVVALDWPRSPPNTREPILLSLYLTGGARHNDVPTASVELLTIQDIRANVVLLLKGAVVHDLLGTIGDDGEVVQDILGGVLGGKYRSANCAFELITIDLRAERCGKSLTSLHQ